MSWRQDRSLIWCRFEVPKVIGTNFSTWTFAEPNKLALFCKHIANMNSLKDVIIIYQCNGVNNYKLHLSLTLALWEILAKSVQKTFLYKAGFKPVTSWISNCQSHLAIKFYLYFWWISRNLNKVLKTHRNFAFYQSFGRFFQVFLTYTLSEHVRACNFKSGKCIIT